MLDLPYVDMIAPVTTHQTERQQRPGVVLGCKQGGHVRPTSLLLEMMMTRKIIIIAVVVLMCTRPGAAAAKTEYFMDDYSVCSLQGYIDIPSGVTITIHLKKPSTSESSLTKCALRFRAESDKELLRIEYKSFEIGVCGILFKVNLNKYQCNTAKPQDAKLSTREVDIELDWPSSAKNYDGEMLLTTYQSSMSFILSSFKVVFTYQVIDARLKKLIQEYQNENPWQFQVAFRENGRVKDFVMLSTTADCLHLAVIRNRLFYGVGPKQEFPEVQTVPEDFHSGVKDVHQVEGGF
ncbi:uncharacterized protein LOC115225459 [Octopus sinensis]|uniref:Uncharacterized protein LOC115225459 n=1 Tax=Octopus sinensis TaxID=2607531 RepID=A0A7E6FQ60_9MOLL|nr:uncharacterized protein LOC115225459 [Octopus sinensis]